MIDPVSAAVHGLAVRDGSTPAIAFLAGSAASFSPCVAPRALAVAALSVDKAPGRVAAMVASFTIGVIAAYSVLTLGGSVIWELVKYSGWAYSATATGMAVAGIFALGDRSRRACGNIRPERAWSSVFLLGASSVATLSPCCLPVVVAAVLYAKTAGAAFAWLTVTCFALGHMMPVVLAAAGSRVIGFAISRNVQAAAQVVAATLMLAVAGIYFVLA